MTAHATLVVRTGPSDRMATISTAIRALQQKSALKRAAGGATLLGGPRVTLLGEVVELAQPTPSSPLHLPYISPISPLYLPYISPISPLHLA